MKRSSGARIGAAIGVSALSLALITGCSSDDSKGSDGSKAPESSSSPTQAAKALSTAELEKLLLAQGDLDAKQYKVDDGDDTLPKSKTGVKSSKAECEPLVWATAALPPGETDAHVSNTVSQVPTSAGGEIPEDFADALNVNVTFVGLSSYEGDGAEKAMKAVSDGVSACSGGYDFTGEGETTKVVKVAPAKGSGQGDESVAFVQSVDMDGDGTALFTTEVVRKGNTVASFYSLNLAALDSDKASEIPAEVVTAQVGKIK
ncbi:hypothetical protein [Streptomyces sp. TRM68416]|uniref:hypothetical protein n=1 Tax=Streptomyces sp. TRM68416 TaxID=2758412 RepID=UPI001661E039|nr:hypothetical protein [Streptomyces sp. TRM68416]MBD0839376.1 hypothetical protein [Streptomyces sp. TRM68416]